MAQTWKLGVKAVRPGTYYRRSATGIETSGATNGILACIFQSNWGALNKEVDIDQTMMNNLEEYYGDGATILKEGLIGGATTIRAIRVGGDDGTCASVTLKTPSTVTTNVTKTITVTTTDVTETLEEGANEDSIVVKTATATLVNGIDYTVTESDDALNVKVKGVTGGLGKVTIEYTKTTAIPSVDALTISAKYPGDREFTVSVRTNLITDKREILIYDGVDVFDAVNFDKGDDEAGKAVEAFANHRHFTARALTAGLLANVTQKDMIGGTNPTVTEKSYSKGTEILERFKWNCIVADSDDSGVKGMLHDFVAQSYETGHLGMTCVAGQSNQNLEARMQHAASSNDEKTVFLLNGWIANDGTVYDGWRGAARLGGMIAACETNASLTHVVIKNALELIEPLTNGEITRAEEKGCLVLSLNNEDQIWIDNGLNSLVTLDNNMDEGWKKIRRTKCRFELMDRVNTTCDRYIGRLNNDDNGRATLVSAMQGIINEMIAEHKLFEGSYAEEDPAHRPDGDRAYFILHLGDIDSIEKIYLDFGFSYANPFAA